MKEFTKEMLAKITEANDKLRGTSEYWKFHMESYCKNEKGRWFFVGHYIPFSHETGIIKTFKGNTYIITEGTSGVTRYLVNDAVKELLGI